MIDVKKIDWESLRNPSEYLKVFDASKKEKLLTFAQHLVEDDYNLSDELRNYKTIYEVLFPYYFGKSVMNVFYEIGDMDGVLGFSCIQPNFRSTVVLKFWNESAFTHNLVKGVAPVFDLIMDEFKLNRLSSETVDDRVVRMSKMVGFKVEGSRWGDFMWQGKPLTRYLLGKTNKGRKKWDASRAKKQNCS